jgi:uncharacterized protein (TIGR02594 family)
MAFPAGYEWLGTVGQLPKTITTALALHGVQEVVGKGSNKTIIGWRDELNQAGQKIAGYSDDDIPWCGLFAAIVVHRAGYEPVDAPLWAQNWKGFGEEVARNTGTTAVPKLVFASGKVASLGDVLVFVRKGGGHVGFYIGESATSYFVLGGNQGNKVCISPVAKANCIAVRRPPFKVGAPASVKPYKLAGKGGALSSAQMA